MTQQMARRPLPRAGDGEVRAPSPKECAWESAPVRAQQPRPRCGFASTLRLPGTLPPPTLRSTLLAPRLQPGCLSNSPAGVSHARLDCPLCSLLPQHRLPSPHPPQQPPRRLAPDQEDWPPGSPRAARDLPPPRGQLSAVLCVRAASPSTERLPRRRLARKREGKEERGTTRGLGGGQKTTALTLGRFRHGAAFGCFSVSPLPRLLRPARAGAKGDGGGAEPPGPRWTPLFSPACWELGFSEELPRLQSCGSQGEEGHAAPPSASGFTVRCHTFPQRRWLLQSCLAPTSPKYRRDGEAARRALWGPGLGHSPHGSAGTPRRDTGRGDACPLGVLTPGSICHQQSLSLVRRGSRL